MKTKTYYWHTGFPGGLKSASPAELKEKGKDSDILARAVSGMIPKNKVRALARIVPIYIWKRLLRAVGRVYALFRIL